MKKNELISMVDFVFRCDNLYPPMNELEVTNTVHEYGKIKNYANFLNQQLNISQFVPAIKVGDEWEVLEMPEYRDTKGMSNAYSIDFNLGFDEAMEEYQTAKDNVIFEGFKVKWCKSQLDGEEFFGVTLNGQWCGGYDNFISSYLKDDETVNGLNNLKGKLIPTLTKNGVEVSGLNR